MLKKISRNEFKAEMTSISFHLNLSKGRDAVVVMGEYYEEVDDFNGESIYYINFCRKDAGRLGADGFFAMNAPSGMAVNGVIEMATKLIGEFYDTHAGSN